MLGAIDAFCGAGGFSLGLIEAGWRVLGAFDNDPLAVETYRSNIGDHVHLMNANNLTVHELLDRCGIEQGDISLIAGGPPCQGFSLQGPGLKRDPRNALVLRFVDLVLGLTPPAFLMENVPAIGSVRGKSLLRHLVSRTENRGYRIFVETLDAVDYGLAQVRRRTFVVGLLDFDDFVWPMPRTGPPTTVREAFRGLPSPPLDGSPHPTVPNHYRERKLSARNIERIKHVPEGGGREHLPPHLRLNCHANGHRHLDTYGRMAWDAPAPTITARFDSFTRGRFGHPEEHRSVTLREGARLQGFPDDFVFLGSREDGARLIGNAVPPPLAAAIGDAIRLTLTNEGASAVRATGRQRRLL